MAAAVFDRVNVEVLRERIAEKLSVPSLPELEYLGPHQQGFRRTTYLAIIGTSKLIVRVLHHSLLPILGHNMGPPSMASEVATMRFVRQNTRVPVPIVFWYDRDEDGAVGGEWIVTSFIDGIPLSVMLSGMPPHQVQTVALAIADAWSELLKLRFSMIGSINEDNDGIFGVGPMTFLPSSVSTDTYAPVLKNCGPFKSGQEWLLALAGHELDDSSKTPEEISNIENLRQLIHSDPVLNGTDTALLSAYALEHVNLTPENILVDVENPTILLGVIDWEGARTMPLWAIQPRYPSIWRPEEIELRALTCEAIREKVPEWWAATDITNQPGRTLFVLHFWAQCSYWSLDDLEGLLLRPVSEPETNFNMENLQRTMQELWPSDET